MLRGEAGEMIHDRTVPLPLAGRRVTLRPLAVADFDAWREVRRRCRDWLVKWEPRPSAGHADPVEDRRAFAARCGARDRDREMGTGFAFGVFVDGRFAGEVNLNGVQRGPFQNAYLGYWIDRQQAGQGYIPEAVVVALRFAFEELRLHRVQIAIIPRNAASLRVVDKLGLRDEGTAQRYLEIDGSWEDHIRYAMTAEDWDERGRELLRHWL
ncbi:MAG: GNAT family N-acetyltransferase [Acidimicrobiales bacterium]